MNKFVESFQEFFGPLSSAQRTMFVGLAAAIVIFVGFVFFWALKPDYSLLFGSLPTDSAREIMEELDERGVQYKLENDGRAIFVQDDEVHELRIHLASSGVAQADVQGYELFDANALGMTDFMQQVNNKRALEGELARSINSIEQVESSRIHLVLPERTPFQETSVEATASVILNMKRGRQLKTNQVEGITSLIAGSVEDLEAGSVTVLDDAGNRLTDKLDGDSDYGSGSLQMQLRERTESYLTERGQTMLNRVLGSGNSVLRVSAVHDFDRLVRESDIIDPDSRVIISEERRSDVNNDENLQPVQIDEFTPLDMRGESVVVASNNNESSTQTRNYEINKTREIYEKTQGEIERLTASVLLNYKQEVQQNENGEDVVVSEPYSEEEIEEFRQVVQMALGIQPDRGDELSITQIEFHDPTGGVGQDYVEEPGQYNELIRWSLIFAAFLAIVALIYSIRKRLSPEETSVILGSSSDGEVDGLMEGMEGIEHENLEGMSEEEIEDFFGRKLTGKARKQLEQKTQVMDEIRNFVELKPGEAAQVIRAIMTLDDK